MLGSWDFDIYRDMKHLQSFKIFESAERLTPEQKAFLGRCVNGTWTLNPDGKIYVNGLIDLHGEELTSFEGMEFGEVDGSFRCQENSLTSLKGSPTRVDGNFLCYRNDITSLEGGPKEVGMNRRGMTRGVMTKGNYDCDPNDNLVSLVGAPILLGGEFSAPGVRVPEGRWNASGIFQAFKETKVERGKALLGTIMETHVGRDFFQKKIDEDPAAALSELKNHFSEPWFRKLDLKWPGKVGPWVDLMGDAGELGF
jgi:hypothetical protein